MFRLARWLTSAKLHSSDTSPEDQLGLQQRGGNVADAKKIGR
jgi:hypothetical protein